MKTYACHAKRTLAEEVRALFTIIASDGAARAEIDLSAHARVDKSLVAAISESARRTPLLRELVLVHQNPTLGFLCASLCLRLPTLKIDTRAP